MVLYSRIAAAPYEQSLASTYIDEISGLAYQRANDDWRMKMLNACASVDAFNQGDATEGAYEGPYPEQRSAYMLFRLVTMAQKP